MFLCSASGPGNGVAGARQNGHGTLLLNVAQENQGKAHIMLPWYTYLVRRASKAYSTRLSCEAEYLILRL